MIGSMLSAMGQESSPRGPRAGPVMTSERDRLAALLAAHFRVVWRTARRLGMSASAADDAAQQAFVIASERLAEIELGRERAFLIGTVYRVAANARRKDARRQDTAEIDYERAPSSGLNPEELVERKRWRELLDVVLDELPIDLRTVFVLFELEGLSSPEIAAALSVPLGTVASRLRRSREMFAAAAARLRTEHMLGGEP